MTGEDITFGRVVRGLRIKRDWSLRELGRRLGVSAPFLSDIELGRRYPSKKRMIKMARIFKVKDDYLFQFDKRGVCPNCGYRDRECYS